MVDEFIESPSYSASDSEIIEVHVTGGQWYWDIDKQEIPAGKTIIFNLHTKDVNHGFGVIDKSGRLLFQTQAMPGYINKVQYVFDQPGQYQILCLEFCGVSHHDMTDEIKVVAR